MPTPLKVPVHVYFDQSMLAEATDVAKQRNMTRSDLIRDALRTYLQRIHEETT